MKKSPEIVYKYRNWKDEHHKNVLKKNQLFLASPKDCNDPFDCRIPMNFNLLNSKVKIDQYLKILKNDHSAQLIKENRNIEKEIQIIKNKLQNKIHIIQNAEEESFIKIQNEHYGILSLSARWNSILMWSHYSNYHNGYCIGFWKEKLENSNLLGKGDYVKYNPNNNFPEISPLNRDVQERSFIQTQTKANDWSYEKEYRLTKVSFPEPYTNNSRTKTILNEYYAEILIGLNISPIDKSKIIEIAKQKNIPIYQIMKVPWKFKLKRIEIK